MKAPITLLLAAVGFAVAAPPPLPAPVRIIPLPGVEGRFDHASYDPRTNRLFFAALGNNTVEIVDVVKATRVHTVTGLKKPTGVLFLAEWNMFAVANGDDGTCRFFDGADYSERGRITDVEDADNLRFDAQAKMIYLGYGEGALAVIDPATMKLRGRIALGKHPESFQIEAKGPRIFVNIPDAHQIAVVDRVAGKVTSTWLLEGVSANFPMALDEGQDRLFIGCRQPARLLSFDIRTGKKAAEIPLSGDVDDLFFQPGSNRLYASCGEGFVDVIQAGSGSGAALSVSLHLPSAAGARTSFFNAAEGWLCLAVPHRGSQSAELRLLRTPMPKD
ncbi:MAG: hypothetical protein EOP86_07995 [Verrucomicrobiaceae bacterium]|nr:MAG: hypothetical protein EOP86_07995 [Verrucomicrobiaceae bacterium]